MSSPSKPTGANQSNSTPSDPFSRQIFSPEILAEAKQLAAQVKARNLQALSRAITLIESTRPDHRELAKAFLQEIYSITGRSLRIGVSGSPGVGKSVFIEALGLEIIKDSYRVAVLAVDPSSTVSGGSLLGDKTRMNELSQHEAAFIRPSPSGGVLGGVNRHTRETISICEAAGFDVILVETVGVGQSEASVAEMTDMFIVLHQPGSGDELQGFKRGIMELVDLLVINKADGALRAEAERSVATLQSAITLLRSRTPKWKVPVMACSALEKRGIHQVWAQIQRYHSSIQQTGELTRRRTEQAKRWLHAEVIDGLSDLIRTDPHLHQHVADLEEQVVRGVLPASIAARSMLNAFSQTIMKDFGQVKEAHMDTAHKSSKNNNVTEEAKTNSADKGTIPRLNHVAVAVADLKKASQTFSKLPGAQIGAPQALPSHGVTVAFVKLANTTIELLEPLGEKSPIAKFLESNPQGGIHHLCVEVPNLSAASEALTKAGIRVLGDGTPKPGAHGKPVLFLHPKDFCGVLLELEKE